MQVITSKVFKKSLTIKSYDYFSQCLGFPVMNDPLYNHVVFGPTKGKGGIVGKTDDELIQDLIAIHNAENWLGMDGDVELSMFNKADGGKNSENRNDKVNGSDKDSSDCSGSPNSSKGSSSVTNTGEE